MFIKKLGFTFKTTNNIHTVIFYMGNKDNTSQSFRLLGSILICHYTHNADYGLFTAKIVIQKRKERFQAQEETTYAI